MVLYPNTPAHPPPDDREVQPGEPAKPRRSCRIALAHDWLVVYRGGEAVLDAIARCVLAEGHTVSRVYTMFDSGARLSPTLDALPRAVSSLNRWPARARRWLLPLYPRAVSELSATLARDHQAEPIDLLISTSSAAVKGLKPPAGVPHVCYCHAPARYLWSQAESYGLGRGGGLRRLGLSAFGRRLRAWDRATAAHVTRFLANSTHIAAEIRRCYDRESAVVWPPVRTEFFGALPDVEVSKPCWLYAGALEPYKRVDIAIEAANRDGTPLEIVGEGSQASHLRSIAGPSVRFAGRVSDEQLRECYRLASLVLFPQLEDFGIVAVEAQAAGTPVLAFGAGGALDTVIEGRTGAFFREQTADSLLQAAKSAPPKCAAVSRTCRDNARRFAETAFAASVRAHIAELLCERGVRSP